MKTITAIKIKDFKFFTDERISFESECVLKTQRLIGD